MRNRTGLEIEENYGEAVAIRDGSGLCTVDDRYPGNSNRKGNATVSPLAQNTSTC